MTQEGGKRKLQKHIKARSEGENKILNKQQGGDGVKVRYREKYQRSWNKNFCGNF